MPSKIKTKNSNPYLNFTYKKKRVRVILDNVLIFRFIRNLHGRFWGLAGINFMIVGFTICFLIRPDLFRISTPISDFGNDVRTAPYFAGSVFFAAYGLWRWRNYLSRTWKRTMPITGLISVTIIGLYLVALMPISWEPWPYRIHIIGLTLAGVSMLATVVLDGLLTKAKANRHVVKWRLIRFISVVLIVLGGWLTLGSTKILEWYQVSLLGECLMLAGYALWIGLKTYEGEGNRTILARTLKRIVLID
ncbi:MAG: hypothetical protein JWL85_844 [Candidatus Saccharibacteria bacterium]|nr:hypothetical protein [Candidatus Saccharibacteria bacterium]